MLRFGALAASILAGGYGIYTVASRLLDEANELTGRLSESLREEHALRGRLSDELDAVRNRSQSAMSQLLPLVRETLLRCTDLSDAVNAIKASTSQRQSLGPGGDAAATTLPGLWEEVKLRSITRVLTAAYACSLLAVLISVQQTLLIRMKSTAARTRDDDPATAERWREVEAESVRVLCEVFCSGGIVVLAARIRAAVAALTQSPRWNVVSSSDSAAASNGGASDAPRPAPVLHLHDFTDLFHGVRAALECENAGSRMGGIVRALLPLSQGNSSTAPQQERRPSIIAGDHVTATAAGTALPRDGFSDGATDSALGSSPYVCSPQLLVCLTLDAVRSPAADGAYAAVTHDVFSALHDIIATRVFGASLPLRVGDNPSLPIAAALLGLRKAAQAASECSLTHSVAVTVPNGEVPHPASAEPTSASPPDQQAPTSGSSAPALVACMHPAVFRLCSVLLWEAQMS